MLNVTTFRNDTSPFLNFCTKNLYTISGLLPVGKPSTKGFSGVGSKALMRSAASCQTCHSKLGHGYEDTDVPAM